MTIALELKQLKKTYPGGVQALRGIDLQVEAGDFYALLGPNGAGKSTTIGIISSLVNKTSGQVNVFGYDLEKDVVNAKRQLGLVPQEFNFNPFETVQQIVVNQAGYYGVERKEAVARSEKYLKQLDLWEKRNERARMLSGGMKRRLMIARALMHEPKLLILDEPTAVLTPQETEKLFDVLRRMREDNKSIIIITHKLHEVLEISDRVTILRKGMYVGTVETKDATEQSLTEMMMGEKVTLNIKRTEPKNTELRIDVKNLSVKNHEGKLVLDNINFTANSGEILGIAGISGCGQKELLESIAGLQQTVKGSSILYKSKDGEESQLVGKSPKEIRKLGVALSFVPEDRLGMGLVGNMDIIDNMMLRSYKGGHTAFLERKAPKDLANAIIKDLEVVTPSAETPVRRLSGGNVQKVLVGREIASNPTVLMVAYPVRGLDVNSSYLIYDLLNKQKEHGTSVIFVGEDLDVLIELCDRIMVMNSGKVTGIVDGRTAKKDEIGILMTKNTDVEGKA